MSTSGFLLRETNDYDDDRSDYCPVCGAQNYACIHTGYGPGLYVIKETFDMAYKLDRDLYLNADKSKVVEADSEEAAYLLGRAGQSISDQDAEKYGLAGKKVQAEAKAPASAEAKAPKGPER